MHAENSNCKYKTYTYLFLQLARLPGTGTGTAVWTIFPGCFHFQLLRSPVKHIIIIIVSVYKNYGKAKIHRLNSVMEEFNMNNKLKTNFLLNGILFCHYLRWTSGSYKKS